jgi:hypothetical protein
LKLLDGLIVAVDPRGAEARAKEQRRKRWVRIQPVTDGVSWLDGTLTGADGKHGKWHVKAHPHGGHLWQSPLGLTYRVLPDGRTYRVQSRADDSPPDTS